MFFSAMRNYGAKQTYLHFAVEAIIEHQVVRHSNPMGLHRVALTVVKIPHIRIVVVGDAFLVIPPDAGGWQLGRHLCCCTATN